MSQKTRSRRLSLGWGRVCPETASCLRRASSTRAFSLRPRKRVITEWRSAEAKRSQTCTAAGSRWIAAWVTSLPSRPTVRYRGRPSRPGPLSLPRPTLRKQEQFRDGPILRTDRGGRPLPG